MYLSNDYVIDVVNANHEHQSYANGCIPNAMAIHQWLIINVN